MVNHVRHQFELLVLTHDRLEVAADEGGYESRLEHAAIETAYLVALRTIIAFFENDASPYRTGMTARLLHHRAVGSQASRPSLRGRPGGDEAANQRARRAQLLSCFTGRLDTDWQTRFYPSLQAVRTGIQAAGRSGPPDVLE
jgi:hypothetical protein